MEKINIKRQIICKFRNPDDKAAPLGQDKQYELDRCLKKRRGAVMKPVTGAIAAAWQLTGGYQTLPGS